MENVSNELYEQIKAQVLQEIENNKQEKRRINLAAEAVFAPALRKYKQRLANKFGKNIYGKYGNWTYEAAAKFDLAKDTALKSLGFKTARAAYLEGYGEEANAMAEKILEVLLQ